MNIKGVFKRLEPLGLKLGGKLPLCPWGVIFSRLNPRTIGIYAPKVAIEEVARDGDFVKLQFDDRHAFWLPGSVQIGLELWNEYLSVFWDHPSNAHYYARHGTEVRTGDVVIDCGCCEGTFTRQALDAGASKVVCFEPNSHLFASLQRTFAKEIEAGKVVLRNAACGAFAGQASFDHNVTNFAAGQLGGNGAKDLVQIETISEVCKQLNLGTVDLIKMDIEGAEVQAVEGAMVILEKFKPRLAICTYHRVQDFAVLKGYLTAAGYRKILPVGITEREEAGQWRPVLLHAV